MPPEEFPPGSGQFDIPADEVLVDSLTKEKFIGGSTPKLEKMIENYPEKGINTYLFQYRGRKIQVSAPDIASVTLKITKEG